MNWFEEFLAAWGRGDVDAMVDAVADDVVFADMAFGHRADGKDAFRAFAQAGVDAELDTSFDVVEFFETDDGRYGARWIMHPGAIEGASIGRRVEGRIAEHRDYWNRPAS